MLIHTLTIKTFEISAKTSSKPPPDCTLECERRYKWSSRDEGMCYRPGLQLGFRLTPTSAHHKPAV